MGARAGEVNTKPTNDPPTAEPNRPVILLIKLPRTGHPHLRARLTAALGKDAVGWLGRNVSREDIRAGLPGRRFTVLCGAINIAAARRLPDVSLVATVLPASPAAIPLAEWNAARQYPAHAHHAIAHTLSFDEVIEEKHPFARQLGNVATRLLTPQGERPSADAALKALAGRPSLVGLSSQRGAFSAALAESLGIAPERLDGDLFKAPEPDRPDKATEAALAGSNRQDLVLTRAVASRLDASSRVYRTAAPAAAG